MPRKMTVEEFIKKSRCVHGAKYDYSLVDYKNNKTKVEIVCSEHGSFFQKPNNHLMGQGCPVCGRERTVKSRKLSTEAFIQRSRQVHGDKYDYSKTQYVHSMEKVEISCLSHGPFYQIPYDHLNGSGCPKCKGERIYKSLVMDELVFIEKARQVHRNKYDYGKVRYKNNRTKIEIICPQHGSFFQRPNDHLQGHGCPRCIHRVSRGEQELADALSAMGLQVIQSYRKWCPGRPKLEIDIFLPEYSIGIEYNGEYWHSEATKDKEKISLALQQGIRIITIWESEWKKDKDKVLERIHFSIGAVN